MLIALWLASELGWQGDEVENMPFEHYPYEKIECYLQGVRDYIKWLKRGYSRVTQMTALDLRSGRKAAARANRSHSSTCEASSTA